VNADRVRLRQSHAQVPNPSALILRLYHHAEKHLVDIHIDTLDGGIIRLLCEVKWATLKRYPPKEMLL
jgi:hypothetical protein